MSRIKIKNFGPLKETVSAMDGWIDIEKVTVFTGNQGSGKSTVAKLVSTFTWMEKVLTQIVILHMQKKWCLSRSELQWRKKKGNFNPIFTGTLLCGYEKLFCTLLFD